MLIFNSIYLNKSIYNKNILITTLSTAIILMSLALPTNMAAATIIPIDDLSGSDCKYSQEEKEARCKLASVYRLVDMNKWTQGIYNHISVSFNQF